MLMKIWVLVNEHGLTFFKVKLTILIKPLVIFGGGKTWKFQFSICTQYVKCTVVLYNMFLVLKRVIGYICIAA